MTQSVPEYFTLLPSEICRLVLGYLVHSGPESAAKVLFSESIHLSELRAQYKTVADLPLHLTQLTLLDLVYDYLRIANSVAHQLSKLGVVCRLGAVSTVLPHLLKTNPNASAGRRISPVFPTRPSWMPLGKTYLPPRIVHGEPKGPVRLPLLAVRPHLYSDGVSGVPGSRTSSATDVPSQLPSIVSIQGNVGIPRVLSSEPSSSSTSNSRPVIRLYRNPVGTGPPSVLNMVEEQKLDEASDVLSSSPPCYQTTAPTEHSELTPTDTNPELLPAEETERVVVDEPTVSLPEDPIAEAEEVPPSPVDASDEEVERKLETSVETGIESTTEVKSESQAPFTVFQHLPPPTETPAVPSVDVTCDRASDEAISKASSKTKKRKWIPPRHMVTAPEVPEATGTTPATESSSAEDDVDLERFIAALLDHPEQVAGHINAKIGGQSKSVVVQTHPLRLSPPKSSHSCFSSTRPVRSSSPEDQILTDNSLSLSSTPLHPPVSSVSKSNDPGAALLNVDDLDFCIDQLLSEFDAADAEMEDLPDQLIPSATPVPADVVELSVPSRASTPAVLPAANPKQSELKFNSRLASKSPRRPASPLCLSQLTRTAVVAESPNKRRRFYANEAHNGGALRTPDGKIPDFGPQQVQSLQKDLFSTECAMQFYEEFVGFDKTALETPTVSTTEDSRFSIPTKPRTTGVQIATSHCPIDVVQLTSFSASLHTGDPGGEVQRWFPETLPNKVACFSTAPPLSSTVMSTVSPICVPSSILPHISTLLPAVEHRRSVSVNSTDVGVGKPLLPSTFFTGTPESHTTISTATSTLTGSVSRPPTLQFTSVGSTNGAPQTILFYPTVHPTVTSTVTPVRREALRGLNLATNVSSSSNILTVPSISNLGSIENLDGKPVIIHLPLSASIVGTSVSGQLQTVCLPSQSQWTGQQTTIILPFNVDLDSPNPYSLLQSSGSANSAPKGVVPTVTDKENRPPLVVQTSSRRKVLNLGSLDVDHILSQSH